MKICLPVSQDNGKESIIFGHFGSAPFFAVYDTSDNVVSVVPNNKSEHDHGSCMPVEFLREISAEIVLCRGMGLRAANLLLSAGIKPYLVEADTVADAIECYKAKKIRALDAQLACHNHDCH